MSKILPLRSRVSLCAGGLIPQEVSVMPFCKILYIYMPADCSCHVQKFAMTQGFTAVLDILQDLRHLSIRDLGVCPGSAGRCVASFSSRR